MHVYINITRKQFQNILALQKNIMFFIIILAARYRMGDLYETGKRKNVKTGKTMRKGAGVTFKLASAIIVTVVILVSALLELVYIQMSSALLEKKQ